MKTLAILCTICVILGLGAAAHAQRYYAKETALYAEFYGSGGELSANFEKLVGEKVSIRVGAGLTGVTFRQGYVIPFGVSFLLGKDRNFLEIGGGGAWVDIDENGTEKTYLNLDEDQVVVTGMFGYRFIGHYGFTYRLAFTPAYTKDGFEPMGGAAFGYAF